MSTALIRNSHMGNLSIFAIAFLQDNAVDCTPGQCVLSILNADTSTGNMIITHDFQKRQARYVIDYYARMAGTWVDDIKDWFKVLHPSTADRTPDKGV